MKLIDLLMAPWAIEPGKLLEIQAIYATHLRGEKIDIAAIEARLGRPLANEQQAYSVREGGVAVLPIEGVIAPKANLFTRISGGVDAKGLQLQLESALADARVRSIVLAIDSPGGSVFGTPELAAAVREFAAEKPIVAVSDATMASAAYWIGSAANAVYITGPTVQVGSIGVVATHAYNPRRDGSAVTEITAGRYKRIASDQQPLSDEGRAYLQQQVDHIYAVFVEAVAEHRGVSVDEVLTHMADGRVFIGRQAVEAGLVDGVATLDSIVSQLAANPQAFAQRRKARVAVQAASQSERAGARTEDVPAGQAAGATQAGDVMPQEQTLTRESLERDHAALYAQLRSEFMAAGAQAERERIQAVRAQSLPGHEKLIEQLAFDGKTTGPEAAAAVLAAERELRQAAAAAHKADAPPAVPASAAPTSDVVKTKAEQVAEAKKYAADKGIDFVAAMKALGYAQ